MHFERAATDSHKLGRWQNTPRGRRAQGMSSIRRPASLSTRHSTTRRTSSLATARVLIAGDAETREEDYMTGGSHTRLQTFIRIRKYKTTRAALLRLGEPRRHSALGSGLCLPKASMAQYYASDETEIAWTMHSSTGEFSGCARRSLITVRNGACPSCRQGAARSGRQGCAEHSPVGTNHDPLGLWHPCSLVPVHRRSTRGRTWGQSRTRAPLPTLKKGQLRFGSTAETRAASALPYPYQTKLAEARSPPAPKELTIPPRGAAGEP